jgi:hypothetical protein
LHERYNFFAESATIFESEDETVLLALALLAEMASTFLTSDENAALPLHMFHAILAKGFDIPSALAVCALSHFMKISREILMLAHGSGIIPATIPLLESGNVTLVSSVLDLLLDVLCHDVPEMIDSLVENDVIPYLYYPLRAQNENLHNPAATLILRFTACAPAFMERFLRTEIVETLCQLALEGDFKGRSTATKALCEMFYCSHALDVWERIREAGGLVALIDILPHTKPKLAHSILTAMTHIVKHAPHFMEDIGNELMETLEELPEALGMLENENFLNAVRGLQSDMLELIGEAEE